MLLESRNISILTCSQALTLSGAPVVVLLGGIIGTELSHTPFMATMPVAVMIIGTALTTIPAALWMKRVGRRRGFMTAAIIATLASFLAMLAINVKKSPLFCVATLFLDASLVFTQQYRFAATESVAPEQVGKSVPDVMRSLTSCCRRVRQSIVRLPAQNAILLTGNCLSARNATVNLMAPQSIKNT